MATKHFFGISFTIQNNSIGGLLLWFSIFVFTRVQREYEHLLMRKKKKEHDFEDPQIRAFISVKSYILKSSLIYWKKKKQKRNQEVIFWKRGKLRTKRKKWKKKRKKIYKKTYHLLGISKKKVFTSEMFIFFTTILMYWLVLSLFDEHLKLTWSYSFGWLNQTNKYTENYLWMQKSNCKSVHSECPAQVDILN